MNRHSVLSIIVPCYNEETNIPIVFPAILEFCRKNSFNLIVVDDGSEDKSYEKLKQFESSSGFMVIQHSMNRGYGAAIKTGLSQCVTKYAVTIDADGQHLLDDVIRLLDALKAKGADLVVGNRNKQGSSVFRNIGKSMILAFVNLFFRLPFADLNSGMKLYKTDVVKSLMSWAPDGMAYSDVITLLHLQFKFRIVEENIEIRNRMSGESTINWRTAIYTISEISFLILNLIPFRFFSLLSLIIFLFGMIWSLPFIYAGKGVTVGSALLLLTSLVIFLQGLIMELLVRVKFESYKRPIEY